MARLQWDAGERPYFAGLDQAVLYVAGQPGVAWNGLVSINEAADDITDNDRYLDGNRYAVPQTTEDFGLTMSAFTVPDLFWTVTGLDGIYDNQPAKPFGLCYRAGNNKNGRLHIVYNAIATPTDADWKTQASKIDTNLFKWDISTKPSQVPLYGPTSHIVIDPDSIAPAAKSALYDQLYGTVSTNPSLPSLSELVTIFENGTYFRVIDNGDGTFTMIAPNSQLYMIDSERFTVIGSNVIDLGFIYTNGVYAESYRVSSF